MDMNTTTTRALADAIEKGTEYRARVEDMKDGYYRIFLSTDGAEHGYLSVYLAAWGGEIVPGKGMGERAFARIVRVTGAAGLTTRASCASASVVRPATGE